MAGVAGYHPKLIDHRPDLIARWHPFKNAHLDINTIGLYSNAVVVWVCEKNHEWPATVAQRTYQNQGCPYCSGRKPTPENNFGLNCPELVKQWHPTLNKKKPTEYTMYSNEKAWWVCLADKGHEPWIAQISSRTLHNCGCPKCRPRDSKVQLFIYCELKAYFDDVKYRYKVEGMECDIYLHNHKIAIEVDAQWWHKRREKQDKIKSDKLHQLGVTLISLRENGLKEINGNTIRYNDRDDRFKVTKKVFELLYSLTGDKRLQDYKDLEIPVNEDYFRSQISLRPAPLFEKSLAYLNPELAKEWDTEKNGGQTASEVSANCNDKKWWKCDKGHSWPASVGSRNCHGCGCPDCYKESRKCK